MSTSSKRYLVWSSLAGIALFALILCVTYLGQRKDSEIARAIDRLQPGMIAAEVNQILTPVCRLKISTKPDAADYTLYGNDEFLTVVMEKDGQDSRLAKVVHQPDLGPWWERFRRKWESRLR